jgi:hypothetical protein
VFCLFIAGSVSRSRLRFALGENFIGIAGMPLVVAGAGMVFALMLALIGSSVPA